MYASLTRQPSTRTMMIVIPGSICHLLEVEEERKGFARYVQSQFARFKEPVCRGGIMTTLPLQLQPYHELDDEDILSENLSTTPRVLKDLLEDDESSDLLRGLYHGTSTLNLISSTTSDTPQSGCWTAFCFRWRHAQ